MNRHSNAPTVSGAARAVGLHQQVAARNPSSLVGQVCLQGLEGSVQQTTRLTRCSPTLVRAAFVRRETPSFFGRSPASAGHWWRAGPDPLHAKRLNSPRSRLNCRVHLLNILSQPFFRSTHTRMPSVSMAVPLTEKVMTDLQYIQYDHGLESQYLPAIRSLISKDLSEPYSIYVYRYFLCQWAQLCFMVSEAPCAADASAIYILALFRPNDKISLAVINNLLRPSIHPIHP